MIEPPLFLPHNSFEGKDAFSSKTISSTVPPNPPSLNSKSLSFLSVPSKDRNGFSSFVSNSSLTPSATVPSSLAQIVQSQHSQIQPTLEEFLKRRLELRQKIEEIQKNCGKRLPRSDEPPRNKCHWDYLLEEMEWMAKDFIRERRWKKALARKLVRLVLRYHVRNKTKEYRQIKQDELARRRLAGLVSRQIKQFWSKANNVLQFQQNMIVEAKKKEVLNSSLDVLVEQTEHYTTNIARILQENKTQSLNEVEQFKQELLNLDQDQDDGDFEDQHSSSLEEIEDDEATLEEEEEENMNPQEIKNELTELTKESDIPLEDLLEKYHYAEMSDTDVEEEEFKIDDELNSSESDSENSNYQHTWGNTLFGDENKKDHNRLNAASQTAKLAQPQGTTLNTVSVKTSIPFLLRHGTLREYQHIGLDWLMTMFNSNLNGILADEMGLGKTIMTIALLGVLACEKGIWGPHLIVVPTSVMLNWEMEFKRWLPAFKILCYFGKARERKIKRQGWSKPNTFHVCITSYQIILHDQHVFKRKKWVYLILDEAQHIKNFKSQRWQVLLNFNSMRRLLLTGTPLQNSIMELWSLMHFLMPHVFHSHQEFKQWFSNPVTSMIEGKKTINKNLISRLHGVLRPFLLRRLKKDVEKQLPQKFDHVLLCRLSKRQRFLYEDFMKSKSTLDTIASGNYLGLMNIIMQLRKVCNHPDLFSEHPIVSSFLMSPIFYQTATISINIESHIKISSVLNIWNVSSNFNMSTFDFEDIFKLQTPSSFFEKLPKETEENLHPPAFTTDTPSHLSSFHQEHFAKLKNFKLLILSLHAFLNRERCSMNPIYGINLIRLLTFLHPVYHVHYYSQNPRLYFDYSKNILDIIILPSQRAILMEQLIKSFCFLCPKVIAPAPVLIFSHPHTSEQWHQQLFERETIRFFSPIADILRTSFIRQQLYFPDKRLLEWDCGKLQQLGVLLTKLKNGNHRCLIFTQMTKVLNILETFVNFHNWTYYRMDGTTKPDDRLRLMESFNNNPKIFLFILSTRTGGLGVNLIGADTVIFYDSDWNPAIDAQAQDRCHRIGQTREVHIYRLISQNTIEENILKKANQKRQLDNLVIMEGQYTTETMTNPSTINFFENVTLDDLRSLLPIDNLSQPLPNRTVSSEEISQAMSKVEDANDRLAIDKLREEKISEKNEFEVYRYGSGLLGENILRPIDKYAIHFLEQYTVDGSQVKLAILDQQLRYQQNLLRETAQQAGDILSTENRVRRFNPNPDDIGPESELFYCLAGNLTDAYRTKIAFMEQENMLCNYPLIGPPKPPADDIDEIYINPLENQYNEEWCLFSTPESIKRMFLTKKVRRKPKPAVNETTLVNTPGSLTVRIPRVKIKAYLRQKTIKREPTETITLRTRKPKETTVSISKRLPKTTGFETHVMWTREEDNIILHNLSEFSLNWNLICDILKSDPRVRGRLRSPAEIRERYTTLLQARTPHERDLLYSENIAPPTKKQRLKTEKRGKKEEKVNNITPIGLGTSAIFEYIVQAMKRINGERQACKSALRASLSHSDDAIATAIMQVAHNSHKKALTDAQQRLGAPSNLIGKILVPTEIVEYRNQRLLALQQSQNGDTKPQNLDNYQVSSPTRAEPFLKITPSQNRLSTSQITPSALTPYALLGQQSHPKSPYRKAPLSYAKSPRNTSKEKYRANSIFPKNIHPEIVKSEVKPVETFTQEVPVILPAQVPESK